jgi:hypothetical protein
MHVANSARIRELTFSQRAMKKATVRALQLTVFSVQYAISQFLTFDEAVTFDESIKFDFP